MLEAWQAKKMRICEESMVATSVTLLLPKAILLALTTFEQLLGLSYSWHRYSVFVNQSMAVLMHSNFASFAIAFLVADSDDSTLQNLQLGLKRIFLQSLQAFAGSYLNQLLSSLLSSFPPLFTRLLFLVVHLA